MASLYYRDKEIAREKYKSGHVDVAARRRRLSAEYTKFSKAADLPEQRERMKVYSGREGVRSKAAGNNLRRGNTNIPELVGNIDFNNRKEISKVLGDAEQELQGLDYEVNYTVTSDGKVWRVQGDKFTVDPSVIPSDLTGSYSYHNHPNQETRYSFSGADAAFFIASGEQYSKASDNLFEYVMRRTENTVDKSYDEVYYRFKEIEKTAVLEMKWNKTIDPDIDGYHETMKILSEELGMSYLRRKKDGNK